jgi:hypothetical protein
MVKLKEALIWILKGGLLLLVILAGKPYITLTSINGDLGFLLIFFAVFIFYYIIYICVNAVYKTKVESGWYAELKTYFTALIISTVLTWHFLHGYKETCTHLFFFFIINSLITFCVVRRAFHSS